VTVHELDVAVASEESSVSWTVACILNVPASVGLYTKFAEVAPARGLPFKYHW
jgi:hypothetical protein